jgi:four helix bundle protein
MGNLEDLETWKQARELRKSISILVKSFPKEERNRLSDQLIRSSRSCVANIAEGYGRFHFQESIQYCRQSRGSMYECLERLYCVLDEKYIDELNFNNLKLQIQQCIEILNGYILYLKNQKKMN